MLFNQALSGRSRRPCMVSEHHPLLGKPSDNTLKSLSWTHNNCLQENGFMGSDGLVSLKKTHTLRSVDEKLGEEEGSPRKLGMRPWLCAEKNWTDDVANCKNPARHGILASRKQLP